MVTPKKIIVAISGASGALYGIRLLKALAANPFEIHLIVSEAAQQVLKHETDYTGMEFTNYFSAKGFTIHSGARLKPFKSHDFFAPCASGSFKHDGMVIAPCSMRTLGCIANGIGDNLITRAADVCLKEKRPLILLPRETPLSPLHLKNMLSLALAGCTIMPPSPSFYAGAATIEELADTVVARILDHLTIPHQLMTPWGGDDDAPTLIND